MDPITLISLLYKITIFSPKINTNVDENKINQKSRTEIIEFYRSTMKNKKNYEIFLKGVSLQMSKNSYFVEKKLSNKQGGWMCKDLRWKIPFTFHFFLKPPLSVCSKSSLLAPLQGVENAFTAET